MIKSKECGGLATQSNPPPPPPPSCSNPPRSWKRKHFLLSNFWPLLFLKTAAIYKRSCFVLPSIHDFVREKSSSLSFYFVLKSFTSSGAVATTFYNMGCGASKEGQVVSWLGNCRVEAKPKYSTRTVLYSWTKNTVEKRTIRSVWMNKHCFFCDKMFMNLSNVNNTSDISQLLNRVDMLL